MPGIHSKMNFDLKTSSQGRKGNKSQKKSKLGFGLNTRKKKASVLQDDDSSSSEDENDTQSRKSVNKEIAAEQAALRMRAEKAMSEFSSAKSNIYDYDANYESFSSGHHQLKADEKEKELNKNRRQDKKESRYIASLMDKAKERKQEMDIIKERKIAREQEAEGSKDEFIGKDKFITKGYKRVLEERNAWLEKDKKQSKIEEQEDVTKRRGAGVMGLYSNLNIALSGRGGEKLPVKTKELDQSIHETDQGYQINLNRTYKEEEQQQRYFKPQVCHEEDEESVDAIDDELREQAARAKTMEKIFSARDRYLERIGVSQ